MVLSLVRKEGRAMSTPDWDAQARQLANRFEGGHTGDCDRWHNQGQHVECTCDEQGRIATFTEVIAAALAAAYSQGREEHNDLVDLADAFVNYRDRVGPLGFQLEKADFWFARLRAVLAARPAGTAPEAGNGK